MRKAFHEQLEEIERCVVEEAGIVLAQLDRALRAIPSSDDELADEVIAGDDAVDEAYINIERQMQLLLATQAPVASDLRLVTAVMHINIHLERMADLCTNMGKFVKLTRGLPTSAPILEAIGEMGAQVARMIEQAIGAFTARDVEAAVNLTNLDESVDRLNRRMIREVIQTATDEALLEWALRMLLVSRQLERMGDHAVDIGEQVAFVVTGVFREFIDASHKPE